MLSNDSLVNGPAADAASDNSQVESVATRAPVETGSCLDASRENRRIAGWVRRIMTSYRLGLSNVASVARYRMKSKAGLFRTLLPVGEKYTGPFFHDCMSSQSVVPDQRLSIKLFSHLPVTAPRAPDWHTNPLNGQQSASSGKHWSDTEDFASDHGDIKCIWELNRFDWLPKIVYQVAARAPSNEVNSELIWVESWISDWVNGNPMSAGPNWRCGQECSIRCLNMLLAARILGRLRDPQDAFLRFLNEHVSRIAPTLSYALSQDNNHGTSEAAALFLVGTYLSQHEESTRLEKFAVLGRKNLERCVARLIMNDGSFSQYSTVYHRLMLDTLSLVECFRREWNLASFSDAYYRKCRAATEWMSHMTDPLSGMAPNVGHNDGSLVFRPEGDEYWSFDRSVSLAGTTFGVPVGAESRRHVLQDIFRHGANEYASTFASTLVLRWWIRAIANSPGIVGIDSLCKLPFPSSTCGCAKP